MHDETTVLLKKIYRSSKTALDTLSAVSQKSDSYDFESFLDKQQYKYYDIAEDANMQLRTLHQLPDDMDLLSRIEFLATIKIGTMRNSTTNHLAEFLIEGCMGGVIEMMSELNSSADIDPQCSDLAHMLIETEQETIALLQRFL